MSSVDAPAGRQQVPSRQNPINLIDLGTHEKETVLLFEEDFNVEWQTVR